MNRREVFMIAIITFFTVIAWIVFGVFHARTTSTISQKEKQEVVPLTPTFDNDIIRQLQAREEVTLE